MEYASNGKANAGLALGIIGTSLAGLLATGGVGNGSGIFGFGQVDTLKAENAELKAMRYSDQTSIDLYKVIAAQQKELQAATDANYKELMGYIVDINRDVALNKQASYYEGVITNNKIDYVAQNTRDAINYNKQIGELADASILSYVNSTFIPGILKLSSSNICTGSN